MRNTQRNWGNMKHKETYGEMGETCRELPLSGFLSHLVTSFQAVEIKNNIKCLNIWFIL